MKDEQGSKDQTRLPGMESVGVYQRDALKLRYCFSTSVHTARSHFSSQKSTWPHLPQAEAADMADKPQCPCVSPSSFQRHSIRLLLSESFVLCRRLRGHRRLRVRAVVRRGMLPMGLQYSTVRV